LAFLFFKGLWFWKTDANERITAKKRHSKAASQTDAANRYHEITIKGRQHKVPVKEPCCLPG